MWKTVNGYDYPVRLSEDGEVQRKKRDGTWAQIHPRIKKTRYAVFYLYKDGCPVQVSANRLVYGAFHGPTPRYSHIVNLDGDRSNLRLENLALHQRKGYKRVRPRIEQIAPDGSVIAVFDTMVQAAQATYCAPCTVGAHCRGEVEKRFNAMGFSFRYEEEKA